MIAKITPLIRLPSQVDVFDYFVPADLKDKVQIGQMVSVPWQTRYVNGIILSLRGSPPDVLREDDRSQPKVGRPLAGNSDANRNNSGIASADGHRLRNDTRNFRARPIKKIIESQPILTRAQLALIQKFSDYYFVAPGSVARLITPARPKRLGKTAAVFPKDNQLISFKIEKSQLAQLASAAEKIKKPANHIEIGDISSFVWLIFYLLTKQSHPLLLLLPTLNLINIFSAALKKYQTQTAVIHSGLSLGAYWLAYQNISSGQVKVILSTRQGVFLPIPTNSTIIMFDSGSADFKQYDQHPRYDARLAAGWLAALTKSQLILTSPSSLQGETSSSPLPSRERVRVRVVLPAATRQKTVIKLIDMKQNLQSPEFNIISDEAIDEIRQAKTARKKVVIVALRAEAEQGVSVSKIHTVLTKLIKDDKYNIILNRARAERGRSEGSRGLTTRFFPAESAGQNDIIISTPHLLESGQLLPYRGQIACLIIASIEPLLALPDYRAGERALHRLKHWQMWARELAIPKIILQSYSPENPAVRAFAYGETEHFIQTELENRKRFQYPPFAQLIKLTYQGKNEDEINRLAVLLKARASDKLTVRGPYQAHKSEKKSILLKIKNGADLSPLMTLSSDWAIDRDPENVL